MGGGMREARPPESKMNGKQQVGRAVMSPWAIATIGLSITPASAHFAAVLR